MNTAVFLDQHESFPRLQASIRSHHQVLYLSFGHLTALHLDLI